eukprot:CAMPEP_0182504894 /NCGR_PEP_ID=MMETSP1321-20130603/18079_1 /TAXON_ID=91990 /ORGANISM="Bolidomonas sp., Strain RCC1657" /LENGTH=405 /DNA_ID=CAMNT_0024710335 /DNA_START=299 /DNA_END=1513 /DNA_ORIENTATION=-
MSSQTPPVIPRRNPPKPTPRATTTPSSNPNDSNNVKYSPANSATNLQPYTTPQKQQHSPQHYLLNEPTPSPLNAHQQQQQLQHPQHHDYGPPPQTPNTLRNVGRYTLGKLIGRGASGQVYLATIKDPNNPSQSSTIAVKRLSLTSHSPSEVSAIENEIDLLRSLEHKNIVKYLGTENLKDQMQLNIFLQFAEGGSLRQQLNENWGKLNEKQAAGCTLQILSGLSYLHSRLVNHRDIKGANVLVSSTGRLLLTDFGASKRQAAESVASGLKGTPHWMAPEVIKGQQGEDGWTKADVWSVGCTVIEMLTASMPWSNYPNPMAAMYHIANGERPPLTKGVEVSEECNDFIYNCCCVPEPLSRSTVEELLEHVWLSEASEEAAMAEADGEELPGDAMIPGPIKVSKERG